MVTQSKNNAEIKKLIWGGPAEWTLYKDPETGWTGYKMTGNGDTVTVKFKDGSPDQVHTIPTEGTVLFGNGFVHFSH